VLVITRKSGERICVGDDVTVTVLEIAGSSVRLGIEAPASVPVHRYEIWAAVQEENRAAAETRVEDLPSSPSSS
jgi:carbon storage regulator